MSIEQYELVAENAFPALYDPSLGVLAVGDDDNVQIHLQQFNEGVGFDHWAQTSLHNHVLDYLVFILAPNSATVWTGWRVSSTTRPRWRFPVYRLEIFGHERH